MSRTVRRFVVGLMAGLVVATLLGTSLPLHAQQSAVDYILGPGDQLDINILGQTDLSKVLTIRPDGKISLPLIGEMLVTGMTTAQLTEKLTTAFKVYLKDPRVNIMVTQTRVADTLVYVVGQVRSPGSYDMRRGWTVAEVITQAGGVTDKAALTKAMVIRRGSTASIPVDLDKLIRKGDMTANVPVEGGDIILVPEFLNRVLVTGGVRTIGAFDLKEGGRVLDAIVAAGGPNDKGMLNQVAITRQVGEKRILLATVDVNKIMRAGDQSQNILLQHADVIYVPERGFRLTDVLTWLSGLQLVRSVFGF